ncbi:DMT family transporter [Vibrio rumoiensis]|uniref:EamA domain-containing protein n=1 Tax=Vibrio rumoiensis 1S-45 TaxID=1188252 RepID=A0A1E5DZS5_9VIBR|nr:DMT family transporter [Vibrio rumoiensis]OEF23515.1 hypothetical protein A1QC_11595 [Vibrio rumoiensis 1S-45]
MNETTTLLKSSKREAKPKYYFPILEVLLLLVAIFWGTSYGLTKQALIYTSVMIFIAIRFSVTCFFLLPVALKDIKAKRSKDWRVGLPTGAILAAIFFFEVTGLFQTSASKAAFLISLSVIFTFLVEMSMSKRVISQRMFILTVSSVVGVFLLTSSHGFEWELNRGDYFILLAALLRAFMVTMTKRLTEGKQVSNATLTCIQSFVVAVSAISLVVFDVGFNVHFPINIEFWFIMVYLVLCCTLFAFFVQNYAVRKLSPTKVSLLMGSEPMFGALFAVIWLNESLSIIQVIGGCVIFVSVMMASVYKRTY